MTVGDLILELVMQPVGEEIVITTFDVEDNHDAYKKDIMVIDYEDGEIGIVGIWKEDKWVRLGTTEKWKD